MTRLSAELRKPRFSVLHVALFVLVSVVLTTFEQFLPWWGADLATFGSCALAGAIYGLTWRMVRRA